MTGAPPTIGDLEADLADAIYERRIAPDLFATAQRVKTPALAILASQPGAGKQSLLDAMSAQIGGQSGVAVIDARALRTRHPDYESLSRTNPARADQLTLPAANEWERRALKDARARRVNVLLDTNLQDSARTLRLIEAFKKDGYAVHVSALAVPAVDSLIGLRMRNEQHIKTLGQPREISARAHMDAYRRMPESLHRIEEQGRADRVAVVQRDGTAIYDNQRIARQWRLHPPYADKALMAERDRQRSSPELQARTVNLAKLDTLIQARPDATAAERTAARDELARARQHYAQGWQNHAPRAEADLASLQEAQRVARKFGGPEARLKSALAGVSYRGPILGSTAEHVVQASATRSEFVVHSKRALDRAPQVGAMVDVTYPTDSRKPGVVQSITLDDVRSKSPARSSKGEDLDR